MRDWLGEVVFSLEWKVLSTDHSLPHCLARGLLSGRGRELYPPQSLVGV